MIEGTVADVLNQYEVVVNVGSEHGVQSDMEFIVYSIGDEITDPDTGESLGNVERVKARVYPDHIQENITVMRTAETTNSGTGISSFEMFQQKKVPESIAERTGDEMDDKVREGDKVRRNVSATE